MLTILLCAVQVQGTNIRHYYNYIQARAKAFKDTRIDWVREGVGRLKRQTVDKGLLRETEAVQNQISNLLKCDVCAYKNPDLLETARGSNTSTATQFWGWEWDNRLCFSLTYDGSSRAVRSNEWRHDQRLGSVNILVDICTTNFARALFRNVQIWCSKGAEHLQDICQTNKPGGGNYRYCSPIWTRYPSWDPKVETCANKPDFFTWGINQRSGFWGQQTSVSCSSTSQERRETFCKFQLRVDRWIQETGCQPRVKSKACGWCDCISKRCSTTDRL